MRAEPSDVERLRSPGGERFAAFVNDLLRAHSRAHGIPDSAVHTDLQNVEDGGGDAEVVDMATNDASGRMTFPTVWQFKATDAEHAGPALLVEEINKSHAKQRVEEGFVFGACICDKLTVLMRKNREEKLKEAARTINPEAPQPVVLDANDLAAWANDYPAVVREHLVPIGSERVQTLSTWGATTTSATSHYVRSEAFERVAGQISRHVDFSKSPIDVVIKIRGEAGIGKTRLVYEVLKSQQGTKGLVIYTNDESSAIETAIELANYSRTAILVADECTIEGLERLRGCLQGHRNRIRVVAIETTRDNYRGVDEPNTITLTQLPSDTVEDILGQNFSGVPANRRRAYAHLSEGFLRFAVELCRRDDPQSIDPFLPPASFARDYLQTILTEHEQEAVEAIALLDGIGVRGGAARELASLCQILDIDGNSVRACARRVQNAPGFIATAGRYWYITPPVVAQVALDEAWDRWFVAEPEIRIEAIAQDQNLLKPFLQRIGSSGTEKIRERVAAYFRRWAEGLLPEDLLSMGYIDRLEALIEINPNSFLPVLRDVVQRTPLTQLQTMASTSAGRDSFNTLERIARRYALLPRCFRDAESILLQLATAEPESNNGSSARKTYKQLFKLLLSGTTIPFDVRLELLGQRIQSTDAEISALAIAALIGIFELQSSRGFDNPILAGRIADDDWEPATVDEQVKCFDAAINVIEEVIASGNRDRQELIWSAALRKLGVFIRFGYVANLANIFSPELVSEDIRRGLVGEITWLLTVKTGGDQPRRRSGISDHDAEILQNFLDRLRRNDLHGRLVELLGIDRWKLGAYDPDSLWSKDIALLASELLKPEVLAEELDWLCSREAVSAFDFGVELGAKDENGALLEQILDQALVYEDTSFLVGYTVGLGSFAPEFDSRLNRFLDEIEEDNPRLVYEIAINGGDRLHSVDRILRLIDRDALPSSNLRAFTRGVSGRELKDEEFTQVLERLIAGVTRGEPETDRAAMVFVWSRIERDCAKPEDHRIFRLETPRNLSWQLLELSPSSIYDESGEWGDILKALTPMDPVHGARIAAQGLAVIHTYRDTDSREVLQELAKHDPHLVMEEVGRVMLDPEYRYAFSLHRHRSLFTELPPADIQAWLAENGVDGAIAISTQLPLPYFDEDGNAIVPVITGWFLDEFGTEKAVFDEFCRASVHSQGAEEVHRGLEWRRKVAAVAWSLHQHPSERVRDWAAFVERDLRDHSEMINAFDEQSVEWRFRPPTS